MVNNPIQSIPIENLIPHPDNPNRMSKKKFTKLIRNIERTGRYEPLLVRPCPATDCHSPQDALRYCEMYPEQGRRSRNPDIDVGGKHDCFQIINGHYRWKALSQLGYKTVDVVVWDIDDEETDILLATLNCLGGSDVLEKKLALMNRLTQRHPSRDLAKWLPHTAGQIHRLAQMNSGRVPRIKPPKPALAHPAVFFLNDAQKAVVDKALLNAREPQSEKTRAARNAAALTMIAKQFNVES
ncbi:MAG: ParB-like nuclease domain-containing protein [Sedimentisphaerales bacterium]|nr:ParB-like nuclease domain-containing protein [Sedimentisphaerales bacterium]